MTRAHVPSGFPLSAPTAQGLHAVLPIDLRLVDWKRDHLSLNDHKAHHYERSRREQLWQDLAARAAHQMRVGPVPGERARIEIWYRFPDNRRREVGNLQPTSKAIVDGLVQREERTKGKARRRPFVQLLPDDSDRYLVGPDNRRDPVNGPHQVVVRIYRT